MCWICHLHTDMIRDSVRHFSVMADSVLVYTIITGLADLLTWRHDLLPLNFTLLNTVKHIAFLSVKPIRRNESGEDDLALGVEGKHSNVLYCLVQFYQIPIWNKTCERYEWVTLTMVDIKIWVIKYWAYSGMWLSLSKLFIVKDALQTRF